MKKVCLILVCISVLSSSKDITMFFKSDVKTKTKLKSNSTAIEYKPIDILLISKKKGIKFNLVVKGNRRDISKSDRFNVYENAKFDSPKEIEEVMVPIKDFDGTILEGEYQTKYRYDGEEYFKSDRVIERFAPYDLLESAVKTIVVGKDALVEHNHSHEHTHEHNHNHDHLFEHNENAYRREKIDILNPRFGIKKIYSDDVQIKSDIEYDFGKNSLRYIQYLTNFKEEDEERKKAFDAVFQFKNINVFDKKYSLSFIPRVYTEKILIPKVADIDVDFRYKHNKDTVLGAFIYLGSELDNLKTNTNVKTKMELFFDKSNEKHKSHKFYEIVDHEHEKLNQIKLRGAITYNTKRDKNLFRPKLYDRINDKYTFMGELKLKKSDFLIKNFTVENNFNIEHNLTIENKKDRKYRVENSYLLENQTDDFEIFNQNGTINYNTLENLGVYKIKDGYIIYNKLKWRDEYKYIEIIKITYDDDGKFKKSISNLTKIKNDTKVSYKFNDHNKISLSNNINFIATKIKTDYNLINESELIYSYNKDSLKFDLGLKNEYKRLSVNNIVPYSIDLFDISYSVSGIKKTDKLTFESGIKLDNQIQFRKASLAELAGPKISDEFKEKLSPEAKSELDNQEKMEANKWALGYRLKIKPYIDLKYWLTRNINIKTEINFELPIEKSALNYYEGYLPVEKNFTLKRPEFNFNFGLSYIY